MWTVARTRVHPYAFLFAPDPLTGLTFFALLPLPFEFLDSWFRHKRADTGSF
jgi:hypothetical protein